MHMAVEYNYPKIVSFLLKMGADPEIKNNVSLVNCRVVKMCTTPDRTIHM